MGETENQRCSSPFLPFSHSAFSPFPIPRPRRKIDGMARITDVPKVVRSLGLVPLAKKVWAEVNQDDAFTWGSALAYAWIFAIFPFMIFLLTLAPYLPGKVKDKVMENVSNVAYSSVGGETGYNIVNTVNDV